MKKNRWGTWDHRLNGRELPRHKANIGFPKASLRLIHIQPHLSGLCVNSLATNLITSNLSVSFWVTSMAFWQSYDCLIARQATLTSTWIKFVTFTHLPETIWRENRRRHFQTHFLQWKWLNVDYNINEVYSWGFNCQQVSIGSGNGLAPSGDKPLPEPMLTQFPDAYMRDSGEMS